jgi:pimeloyl-ACP methyl ester carboxylesterase
LTSRAAVWVADQFVMRTSDPARRRAILAQDYVAYRRADLRAVQESFRSYYDTDFAGYAGRVTAPTLLITGGRDGLAPPASVRRLGEAMRRAGDPVPGANGGARLTVVDRAGHLFPAEEPDAAGALLDAFLVHRRSPVDNVEPAL